MRVAVFSCKPYDRSHLSDAINNHELVFLEPHLNEQTAILATDVDAVCCFVNDTLSAPVLKKLNALNVKLIVMRCAGYNNIDIDTAQALGFRIARVPEYSPHAIAEHACAMILDLNRNIHRAYYRIRENDYALNGLMGFDLYGKTVGVMGTGKIGVHFAKIMSGFGCQVLAYDPTPSTELREIVTYVDQTQLLQASDIISLHCPLLKATHHLINRKAIATMKTGVMLINTSRGGLVDTPAVIEGLKTGKIGYVGLDVYEEEADLFFEDNSDSILQDDTFARLLTFPNVLITGHQAFFTREALAAIAQITGRNLDNFIANQTSGKEWIIG